MEELGTIGFATRILTAREISAKQLARNPTNLNALSHNAAISLVQAFLDEGIQIKKLFVDTVGPASTYQEKLQNRFPSIKVTVAPKADGTYKVVGAASIKAKVQRDNMLEEFKYAEPGLDDIIDKEYGSGYPSDEATIRWMDRNFDPVFGWPSILRFSWSTAGNMFKEKKAAADFDTPAKISSASNFFGTKYVHPVCIAPQE